MDQIEPATDSREDKLGVMGEVLAASREKFGHVKHQVDDAGMFRELGNRLLKHIADKRSDEAPGVLAIPASAYTDPAIFAAEKAAIFDRLPMLACLSVEIPNPGDYRRVEDLDTPIFVTRTRKGEVKAFVNACRHRAAALVTDDAGSAKGGFTCPYHGWSYTDEGRLKGIPCAEAFDGIDKEARGLVEVACAERHGLVFIARRPGVALDVAAYLGPDMDRELALWRFGAVTGSIGAPIDLKGNWKLVYETFLESYHFAQAHRHSLAKYYHSNVMAIDKYDQHQRVTVANLTLADHLSEGPADDRAPQDHMLISYVLFPGIVLISTQHVVQIFRIFPKDVDHTIVQHSTHAKLPLETYGENGLREVWLGARNIVMNDDFPSGVTTAQRSLSSGVVSELLFGRLEVGVQNNHAAIAAALKAEGFAAHYPEAQR